MSYFDYKCSLAIAEKDYPFYALIMAAMRQADSDNLELLSRIFPNTRREFEARFNAPGGLLPKEQGGGNDGLRES